MVIDAADEVRTAGHEAVLQRAVEAEVVDDHADARVPAKGAGALRAAVVVVVAGAAQHEAVLGAAAHHEPVVERDLDGHVHAGHDDGVVAGLVVVDLGVGILAAEVDVQDAVAGDRRAAQAQRGADAAADADVHLAVRRRARGELVGDRGVADAHVAEHAEVKRVVQGDEHTQEAGDAEGSARGRVVVRDLRARHVEQDRTAQVEARALAARARAVADLAHQEGVALAAVHAGGGRVLRAAAEAQAQAEVTAADVEAEEQVEHRRGADRERAAEQAGRSVERADLVDHVRSQHVAAVQRHAERERVVAQRHQGIARAAAARPVGQRDQVAVVERQLREEPDVVLVLDQQAARHARSAGSGLSGGGGQ